MTVKLIIRQKYNEIEIECENIVKATELFNILEGKADIKVVMESKMPVEESAE